MEETALAGEYRTKQRAFIMQLLARCQERHLSAEEIEAMLAQEGHLVSRATIYRCLDRLVEQGEVRRYSAGDGKSACYQLMQDDCQNHYHCRCTQCGALLHVSCEQLDRLRSHLLAEHGFTLDPARTVLYGLCAACAEKETK